MAIHFHLKPCALSSSRTPSTETAEPKNAASGITALTAKAAELAERAKLMRTISELEDEIALQMCTIGEMVYATHRGTPSDSDEMQKILEYVDDLEDEIEGHEQQLKLLMGIFACPVCGEDVSEEDVYCQKCGQPLPVSSNKQS